MKKIICISIYLLTLFAQKGQAQIYINEVLASNQTIITDAEGDFSDWIELYNAGSSIVNLKDWYLTEPECVASQWMKERRQDQGRWRHFAEPRTGL